MYTPTGDEVRYYYKTDSDDMRSVLSYFHVNKFIILETLHILLSGTHSDFHDVSKYPDKTIIFNDLVTELKNNGHRDALTIVTHFLHAYFEVYFQKQQTNLNNDINNEFFQDYVVKFILLTTAMVTLTKSAHCSPKVRDFKVSQSNLCTKPPDYNLQQQQIAAKRRETAKKNKEAAAAALAKQKEMEKETSEKQKQSRAERAAARKVAPYTKGGSTKIILYLVKIEKIRELNKKLRKNKTKNKNKIEKNNKLIDELKSKIKKQKEKEKLKKQKEKKLEKQKLKKQKEKEKLKKQKEKEKKKGKSKKKK